MTVEEEFVEACVKALCGEGRVREDVAQSIARACIETDAFEFQLYKIGREDGWQALLRNFD
jgi:hypothetical protein